MQSFVWERVNDFIKELRCENISRESYIMMAEYKKAMEEKSYYYLEYKEILEELPYDKKKRIIDYIDSLENLRDAECDKTYMQGWLDCILVLVGFNILESRIEVKNIVDKFK